MKVIETALPGVLIIEPKVFSDQRGYFFESSHETRFKEVGINKAFVQDNISRSSKDVLRGLHYQLEKPQAKLVSVIRGAVFDVAVDIRHGSPTFGQWVGVELSDSNHRQLYVPEGFAHGFAVLSDVVDFHYKCSDYYHPQAEYGVHWGDPNIGIAWNISAPILSEKDKVYPFLEQIPIELLPKYQG